MDQSFGGNCESMWHSHGARTFRQSHAYTGSSQLHLYLEEILESYISTLSTSCVVLYMMEDQDALVLAIAFGKQILQSSGVIALNM